VGLIARNAEAAGISTLCMSSALDITKSVNPPRGVFLDYPLGHTAGPPNRPDIQRQILMAAMDVFSRVTKPGTIGVLDYKWPTNPDWKNDFHMMDDDRLPRYDTPQYQSEEDRLRHQNNDFKALANCGCPECAGKKV
jgi:hypothetical protein